MIPITGPDNPLRENFFSSVGGNHVNIHLGSYKEYSNPSQQSLHHYKKDLVAHSHSNPSFHQPVTQAHLPGNTKFGKGFQRRLEKDISNPIVDNISEYKQMKEEIAQRQNEHRTLSLRKVDSSSHFDVINGTLSQDSEALIGPLVVKPEGKRRVKDVVSGETLRIGQNILRESAGRFFAPVPSGDKHDFRQETLILEGCREPRFSSVIQRGKKDLPSYGVEDQFSRSSYDPRDNTSNIIGLTDYRTPGAFTPRKQYNHPSANPDVVQNWTRGVDLNGSCRNPPDPNRNIMRESIHTRRTDTSTNSSDIVHKIKARLSQPTCPW